MEILDKVIYQNSASYLFLINDRIIYGIIIDKEKREQ